MVYMKNTGNKIKKDLTEKEILNKILGNMKRLHTTFKYVHNNSFETFDKNNINIRVCGIDKGCRRKLFNQSWYSRELKYQEYVEPTGKLKLAIEETRYRNYVIVKIILKEFFEEKDYARNMPINEFHLYTTNDYKTYWGEDEDSREDWTNLNSQEIIYKIYLIIKKKMILAKLY